MFKLINIVPLYHFYIYKRILKCLIHLISPINNRKIRETQINFDLYI